MQRTAPRLLIVGASAMLLSAVALTGCAGPVASGAVIALDDAGSTVCAPADVDRVCGYHQRLRDFAEGA